MTDEEDYQSVMAAMCINDETAVAEVFRIKQQAVRDAVTKIRENTDTVPPIIKRAMDRAADLIDPDYYWEQCSGACGEPHAQGDHHE